MYFQQSVPLELLLNVLRLTKGHPDAHARVIWEIEAAAFFCTQPLLDRRALVATATIAALSRVPHRAEKSGEEWWVEQSVAQMTLTQIMGLANFSADARLCIHFAIENALIECKDLTLRSGGGWREVTCLNVTTFGHFKLEQATDGHYAIEQSANETNVNADFATGIRSDLATQDIAKQGLVQDTLTTTSSAGPGRPSVWTAESARAEIAQWEKAQMSGMKWVVYPRADRVEAARAYLRRQTENS